MADRGSERGRRWSGERAAAAAGAPARRLPEERGDGLCSRGAGQSASPSARSRARGAAGRALARAGAVAARAAGAGGAVAPAGSPAGGARAPRRREHRGAQPPADARSARPDRARLVARPPRRARLAGRARPRVADAARCARCGGAGGRARRAAARRPRADRGVAGGGGKPPAGRIRRGAGGAAGAGAHPPAGRRAARGNPRDVPGTRLRGRVDRDRRSRPRGARTGRIHARCRRPGARLRLQLGARHARPGRGTARRGVARLRSEPGGDRLGRRAAPGRRVLQQRPGAAAAARRRHARPGLRDLDLVAFRRRRRAALAGRDAPRAAPGRRAGADRGRAGERRGPDPGLGGSRGVRARRVGGAEHDRILVGGRVRGER